MKSELLKRSISSIFLMSLIFLSALINEYIFLSILFIVVILSWIEWVKVIEKIRFKKIYRTIHIILFLIYLLMAFIVCFNVFIIDKYFFLTILMICVFSDIGGYVFGKIIGGKKLTKISPNKTISGSVGSFIMSLVLVPFFYFISKDKLINVYEIIILTALVCLFCQLGDLIISFLKRKAKVKDTSNILPGHGGFLDRFDGFLLAMPIGYLVYSIL